MYLKRLEIQGFKSFADKTLLEFKPGITAVIGPNGSGKSNVSDAIRWVLGEQSVKALRGSKLEDVIFSGTQARKSVSFAEVDMTIDNSDGKLPVDYSEVTVTRRVYRNGESEFFINKNQCRLKDIVELFMDTGIGRDGYSIIGQGRIDEILSTKSEERRHIFEEAAGIVKYRTRKEEAEKKLENTKQNLVRINDIVSEIENQLGPLETQADKAKIFLELRDRLKYLEIGLFINNIEKSKEKLSEVIKQMEEIAGQITDEEEKLTSIQSQKEELRIILENLYDKINDSQNTMFEKQNKIEKQKADSGIYKERIIHNTEKYETYAEDIEKSEQRKKELEKDKEDRNTKKSRLSADKEKFQKELDEKEAEFNKLSESLTNEQKKIEEKKKKIMDNIDLKFEKMEVLRDLTANVEASTRRVKQIDEEISDNIHSLDKEKMAKEDEAKELNEVSSERNKLLKSLEELTKIKNECNDKILAYENDIRRLADERNNKESRYKFLVEIENEFEGYARAVKEVLSKCHKDSNFGKNIYGAVASLIKVPAKYETAIEMTLGGSLQNIVTETEYDAKRAIDYLKTNNLGRASFLPIASVKPMILNENMKGIDGVLGIAADLVEFDKKYDNVVKSLLGRTVIVDNNDVAIMLAKKFKYSFRIVTLDGDVINQSGQMTGGSVTKKTTSLLSRSREIEELKQLVEELKAKHEKTIQELKDYKESVELSLASFDETNNRLGIVQISFATETAKMNEIDNNIDRFNKKLTLLRGEKENLSETIKTGNDDIDAINQAIKNMDNENEELQMEVDSFAKLNSEQQKKIDDLNSDIVDLKISVSSFDESALSIDEMLAMLDQEINNCVENVENKTKERERLLIENDEMKVKIDEIKSEIQVEEAEILELETMINDLKRQREEKNSESLAIDEKVENQFKTLDILKEQTSKMDIRKAKLDSDIETIQNKMWEEYETTPNNATNYATVEPGTAKEVEKIKNDIKKLGTINVNAIEEYKTLKDRFEFLTVQKEDLESSEKSLNKIIQEMVEIMKIQFSNQFAKINQNFSEVFKELFGGGYATLKLSDESNVLESGIEIEVQPPGKKLQNMMLLSGGERALTAIALLFAILKLSPSPFCILDEIEAALDDVNVFRYADYLKKFSEKTQFLVITHRKGTMEAANTLYGVTMQEHGISNLFSMQLEK
ncbi:MAG: chromosome segregation protein SMC [Clostridia bacterium]|nr:chromosome segregation protein SMC [Clostridia bacterium]